MPTTTSYEFGDVVLVAFPFTDQLERKKRPAVVVSSQLFHRSRADLLLMAITGQLATRRPGDLEVREWQRAGLLKPSLVKPIVATLEQGLVLKRLGRFSEPDRDGLAQVIRTVFGP
jgi:mRNA interferase MazF